MVDVTEAEVMRGEGKVYKPGVSWVEEAGKGRRKRPLVTETQGKRMKKAFTQTT